MKAKEKEAKICRPWEGPRDSSVKESVGFAFAGSQGLGISRPTIEKFRYCPNREPSCVSRSVIRDGMSEKFVVEK